jgi:type II secretory pathway pseudopilin PulG
MSTVSIKSKLCHGLLVSRRLFIKGQSLFEVLFAIGVVSIILVGVISLTTSSIRNASFSNNNAVAAKYAQEATEWLREQRDSGWSVFVGYSGGAACMGTLDWTAPSCLIPGTTFERRRTLTASDADGDGTDDTVETLVVVSWSDSQGTHEARSVTRLTNWRR